MGFPAPHVLRWNLSPTVVVVIPSGLSHSTLPHYTPFVCWGGFQILVLYTCVTRSFQNIPLIEICPFQENNHTNTILQFHTQIFP